MNSKAFRNFGGTALMLSAALAAMLPEAVQAAPSRRVRVTNTAKVNITNVPTVNINGTPIVRLETGSTVALQPGSAVSLAPGTTVSLPPDATVGLQPGAAVALQPGSTVGLQPGSTVSLPTGTKVGLDAGTTVKVDPTSVLSVTDDTARQATQMAFTFGIPAGQLVDSEPFTVPDDTILVIEHLSCSAVLGAGTMYADLTTTVGGVGALHSFFPSPSFQDGSGNRVIISASTRLYAVPTPAPTMLTVRRTNGAGSTTVLCSLSGHYVDAPGGG